MSEAENYLQRFLVHHQLLIPGKPNALFEKFAEDPGNQKAAEQILANQKMLMANWKLIDRVDFISRQHVTIPNAAVGKPYAATLDFEKLGWNDIQEFELGNLDETGLAFDKATKTISGVPVQSGDFKLAFQYRLLSEVGDKPMNERPIGLIINPDPKTLWKALPSPADAPFQKPDEATAQVSLGGRTFVAASKRGRSHANTGAFRDDDFAYKDFDDSGWSLIAVADGAGSAKFSREGSRLACDTIAAYFGDALKDEKKRELDALIEAAKQEPSEANQQQVSQVVYQLVSGAAFAAHNAIKEKAQATEATLKDFHTTLVFVLFKKYAFGYALLSFSVGDCPAVILNRDLSEVMVLNKLDVGEFSGGTRFLTMPEIFASAESLKERCGFRLVDDFSYLVLMTDGIYDPKFAVEANLEKMEHWQQLLNDLGGENEEGVKVELTADNNDASNQLLTWMDFWSTGNHDDRTIALVF